MSAGADRPIDSRGWSDASQEKIFVLLAAGIGESRLAKITNPNGENQEFIHQISDLPGIGLFLYIVEGTLREISPLQVAPLVKPDIIVKFDCKPFRERNN